MPIHPKSADQLAFKEVIYEKKDWVARITINRPFNYNSYSTPCLGELIQAFNDAAFDDNVAVVVFTGMGDKAFSTGGDVKEYQEQYTARPRDYWKYMGLFSGYIESIMNCGKPTIARINGMAVGGGNESQMACDLGVIAEHAFIAQVGTSVGSVACGGATQWLPILVGDRRAREMLMMNPRIPPYQALDWGLVNRVVPSVTRDGEFIVKASPDEIKKAQKGEDGYAIDLSKLDEEIDGMVKIMVDKFPECMRYTKEQTNFWKKLSWHQTIGHARDWLAIHYTSLEPWEGMTAFVEKRKARYTWVRERAANDESSEFLHGPYTGECAECGAKGIPEQFSYCGACGAKLNEAS
jgi:enoyl-CoA hydratase/carnithine racemase